MNVFFESCKIKVICKDDKNEYELLYPKFNESDTEIKIETPCYNDDLHRGWIGDLSYKTDYGRDIKDCNYVHDIIKTETYQDMLLSKINIVNNDGNIDWEYVFLKKQNGNFKAVNKPLENQKASGSFFSAQKRK